MPTLCTMSMWSNGTILKMFHSNADADREYIFILRIQFNTQTL